MSRIPYRVYWFMNPNEKLIMNIPSFLSHCRYIKIEMLVGSIYSDNSELYKGDAFLCCDEIIYDQVHTTNETPKCVWLLSSKRGTDNDRYPIYLPYKPQYTFYVGSTQGDWCDYFYGTFIFELSGVDL